MGILWAIAMILGITCTAETMFFIYRMIKTRFEKKQDTLQTKSELQVFFEGRCNMNRATISALLILAIVIIAWVAFDSLSILPDGLYGAEVVVKSGSRQYTLPCEIEVRTNSYSNYNAHTGDEFENYYKSYYLVRAYWPNGGWLFFGNESEVSPEYSTSHYDQNGREWHVTIHGGGVERENLISGDARQKSLVGEAIICACILMSLLRMWYVVIGEKKAVVVQSES